MNKLARQNTIAEVISAARIRRQDEIAKLLRKTGFSITQASVSRDLDELGAVKVNGYYEIPKANGTANSFGVISLDTAGENLIVVKCSAGLASAAAVRIDTARVPEIVGTIAGDDTIFVAVKDSKDQKLVIREVRKLFG